MSPCIRVTSYRLFQQYVVAILNEVIFGLAVGCQQHRHQPDGYSQRECKRCEQPPAIVPSHATDRPVRLEVTIPPGIDDGGKIRLRPDETLEIMIRVKVAADTTFRRTGADLHTTVNAPYTDVVLGGEVEIPKNSNLKF